MGDGVEFDWYDADELQRDREYDAVLEREHGTKLIFQGKFSENYIETLKSLTKDEATQLFLQVNSRAVSIFGDSENHQDDNNLLTSMTPLKELQNNFDKDPQKGDLTGWLTSILPYEWRTDLEELRRELFAEGRSRLVVSLITLKSLLEMVWAGLQLIWENLMPPIKREIKR